MGVGKAGWLPVCLDLTAFSTPHDGRGSLSLAAGSAVGFPNPGSCFILFPLFPFPLTSLPRIHCGGLRRVDKMLPLWDRLSRTCVHLALVSPSFLSWIHSRDPLLFCGGPLVFSASCAQAVF